LSLKHQSSLISILPALTYYLIFSSTSFISMSAWLDLVMAQEMSQGQAPERKKQNKGAGRGTGTQERKLLLQMEARMREREASVMHFKGPSGHPVFLAIKESTTKYEESVKMMGELRKKAVSNFKDGRYTEYISMAILCRARSRLKTLRATGPDRVPTEILRALPRSALRSIQLLFDRIFTELLETIDLSLGLSLLSIGSVLVIDPLLEDTHLFFSLVGLDAYFSSTEFHLCLTVLLTLSLTFSLGLCFLLCTHGALSFTPTLSVDGIT
jgi:hypothetical protein